jgi:3alpha(or 20beta)-hydroxysteroid dehydrogenase
VAEGAKVVLGDILDEAGERLGKEFGNSGVYIHLDVSNERDWSAAVRLAQTQFGKLDVLVNNAGILYFGAIADTPLEEYMMGSRA